MPTDPHPNFGRIGVLRDVVDAPVLLELMKMAHFTVRLRLRLSLNLGLNSQRRELDASDVRGTSWV